MDYGQVLTERLLLRKPNHNDLHTLFTIHSDPKTNVFNPSGVQTSIDESKGLLKCWLSLWKKYGFGYWTVVKRDKPEVILGFGGLSPKEINGKIKPNLYFRFSPDAWGKGYATEMAKTALRIGCELLDYETITALVRPDNQPSIKLLERLRLERCGETNDKYGISYFYEWRC